MNIEDFDTGCDRRDVFESPQAENLLCDNQDLRNDASSDYIQSLQVEGVEASKRPPSSNQD
jgi:hypothetical protein